MGLYSDPPPLLPFRHDKPTLLVCWWVTAFCTVIILLRIGGRFVRTEKLFREDKTAALALIPLFARMACVHYVLLNGTNNAQLAGANLSAEELHRKSIASGLVLASRIFYAATLWILKYTILEFLKRLTGVSWERSYETTLLWIRLTLAFTFIAVVIADLSECQPFRSYWQVLPDPGGQCRQGYAQLLTMAVSNVLTDLLLVIFPIPIILRSHMTIKRKAQLILLFSLSLAVVGTTFYRVPHIIAQHGNQQLRSLLASIEILFATAAANALVLGSFVRDRGVKKKKFKYGSIAADSLERPNSRVRQPTLNRHWGSDEDLVRGLGLGVNPSLRGAEEQSGESSKYHPAPLAKMPEGMEGWQFPGRQTTDTSHSDTSLLRDDRRSSTSNSLTTPRRVSFFDVGGLLDDVESTAYRGSVHSSVDPLSPAVPPPSTLPASASGFRRGSTALLQDIGGLFPFNSKPSRQRSKHSTELQPIPQAGYEPDLPYADDTGLNLMDPGGLLGSDKLDKK